MAIKEGDRVIATERIKGDFFTKVPQGTKGKVTHVGGIFGPRYTVVFDNGCTHECSDVQVAAVKERTSWW